MNLLDTAESWLTDLLGSTQARIVTYKQGPVSKLVLAVPTDVPVYANQKQPEQALIEFGERWYQIRLSDFVAAGFELPDAGDRITETLGSGVKTFQVWPSDTEPAWKWLDELETAFQVRTKVV